jgi:hypothetical protein
MLRFSFARVPVLVALPGLVALMAGALLIAVGPAAAHTGLLPVEPTLLLPAAEPASPPAVIPVLRAVPEPVALPWTVLLATGLMATAVWWRPRRAVALSLILLLSVFAFESALHSVHHGLDSQQGDACVIAAAAAHVSAGLVDANFESEVLLRAAGTTPEHQSAGPAIRFLSPDQGRAPPSATL